MVTVSINGRLTNDPEQSDVNGYRITRINVAARTNKKDAQGQYITNFYRCSCFGTIGDTIIRGFAKGDGIVVTGSLSVREYISTSGEKKFSLDVEIRDFDWGIGKKPVVAEDGTEAAPAAPAPKKKAPAPVPVEPPDDELPF